MESLVFQQYWVAITDIRNISVINYLYMNWVMKVFITPRIYLRVSSQTLTITEVKGGEQPLRSGFPKLGRYLFRGCYRSQ